MILSVISVVAMGVMFMYMVNKAHFTRTRQAAMLPLAACVMEILAAGLLHPLAFPALTAVLVVLRLVILGCCAGIMHEDAVKARQRDSRKAALKRTIRDNVTPLQTRPSRRAASRCA